MTDKTRYLIYSEALSAEDRDAFISDWALSSAFPEDSDLAENAAAVAEIWDAAHLTVRDVRLSTGLSQAQFAERFLIPRRSIENWESGARACPQYVVNLLAIAAHETHL